MLSWLLQSLQKNTAIDSSFFETQNGGTDLALSPELWEDDETVRRVGGPTELAVGADECHLRLLMDHSCIEVFASTGEVLSTRIYRCGRSCFLTFFCFLSCVCPSPHSPTASIACVPLSGMPAHV